MVSCDRPQVECYRFNDRARWKLESYDQGERFAFENLDLQVDISAIYEDI